MIKAVRKCLSTIPEVYKSANSSVIEFFASLSCNYQIAGLNPGGSIHSIDCFLELRSLLFTLVKTARYHKQTGVHWNKDKAWFTKASHSSWNKPVVTKNCLISPLLSGGKCCYFFSTINHYWSHVPVFTMSVAFGMMRT